jgi:hypothetical protein
MKEEAATPLHGGTVRFGQTGSNPPNRIKPSQTGVTQVLAKNKTILSEMLMLMPWPKLHSVGLFKPNQTKSNLRGGKNVQSSGLNGQNPMFKTLQYANKPKQG